MEETDKIWINGELVDWADARVHVGTHGLHYGSGVFEGIRCYETAAGPAVFRLQDHLERLENSAKVLYIDLPYSGPELRAATHELIATNGLATCYIRPMAFFGYGELAVGTLGNPVDVVIMSFPWGAYLGEEGQQAGITTKISSWERVGPNVIPHAAKATGVYLNSMLATTEARRSGYDEAIMLSSDGYVADGPGENVFIVKNNVLRTPPLSMSILPGITRDTIIHIARDLGYQVEETLLVRSDLYLADEVFMVGTATEVAPVRAVDDREIGVGPVTRELQKAYLAAVTGIDDRWRDWPDVVAVARTHAEV
jgi:branched-chain amino acid aminotransferase